MPGLSTGLSPKIQNVNTDLSADTRIPVCKFDTTHVVTDAFYIPQSAITGNTTDFATMTKMNGKTTGNQTLGIATAAYQVGGKSVSWAAYTAKAHTTDHTYTANQWLVWRTSEDGTVALGTLSACFWAVQGTV